MGQAAIEPPQAQVEEEVDREGPPRAAPGGYDCEVVEPPPARRQFIPSESECSICLLVLREPHIVSCCGHNFCETCIEPIQSCRRPCPLCNEPSFTTMANKGLKRRLLELQVHCSHRQLGCKWGGELRKLDHHLNVDPRPDSQLVGCPFTSIECVHCMNPMKRQVTASHQNEHCPKRPYTCKYCEEYESTFEDVVDHWKECMYFLLPCPNHCLPAESDGIQRQHLEHHVKEDCSLTVVECDFHYTGCGVMLTRKDMSGHMKEESMAHISLLAAENQRLAKQLLERDEKMQQLTQQNTELSKRIDQQQRAHQELVCTTEQQQKANQEAIGKITMILQQQQTAHNELASKVALQSI